MNIVSRHPIDFIESAHGIQTSGTPTLLTLGLEHPILLFSDRTKIVLSGDDSTRGAEAALARASTAVLTMHGHTVEQAENLVARVQYARAEKKKAWRDYFDRYGVLQTFKGYQLIPSRYAKKDAVKAEKTLQMA